MAENKDSSEEIIKSKLEEVNLLLKILEERKSNLLKALEALKMTGKIGNRYEFNPPIPKDAKPIQSFLIPRVLETHREKYGINYTIIESIGYVSGLEFSDCKEEHKKEIIKACDWVQKVMAEK